MLTIMLLAALTPHAGAKDLRSRVGVGFNQQFGGVTAISVRYGLPTPKPTLNVQLELDGGVSLTAGMGSYLVGGRLLYGVVAEDNLNLYLGAGAAYFREESELTQATGLRLQPSMGAQFFLFGLENLGFTAEWGLNFDLGSPLGIKTVGSAPSVAVHYYF